MIRRSTVVAERPKEDGVENVLLPDEPITSLDEYLAFAGGSGIEAARRLGADRTRELVAASGLRGRGGGGFPTGRKWAGIARQRGDRRYVVANGAEGEPGTFKDRALLRSNPYQILDGILVAAYAVGAADAFLCVKESFRREIDSVTRAIGEMQDGGMWDDCTLTIIPGPTEYLFGEEKAMLEVIEGKPPLPRWFAPHEHGLFAPGPQEGWEAGPGRRGEGGGSNPTLVNNVETLANVPPILLRGADWFRSRGTDASPGTVVATVVGDVVAPGVGEIELGMPLSSVVAAVGAGPTPGSAVKAVFPGVANAVVVARDLDVSVSYEGFARIGSGIGSAGFIVADETACMIDAAYRFSRFLAVESCGQCPPCKIGSTEITTRLERIETGVGSAADVDAVRGWLTRVTDGSRCFLASEERRVVASILRAFPYELADHLDRPGCPGGRRPMPLLVDIDAAGVVYDEAFWRKRPDWTYDEPASEPADDEGAGLS